ncbi:MAG: hypothetical protein B0A82_05950 [Alkalinema sp. CACIAM 70d]|nr:MAG: hypothetical protein B0A82_05950 [Alkalinema sp. CACIAM 70d]
MIPVSQPFNAAQFSYELASDRDARSGFSYRDLLSPWCIVQHLPNCQRLTVARFRKRNDASEHLKVLRRLNSQGAYEIVFEVDRA